MTHAVSTHTIDAIRSAAVELRRQVLAEARRQDPHVRDAIAHLHPTNGAKVLGYSYAERPDLDLELHLCGTAVSRKRSVIAGVLDRPNRRILVSAKDSLEVRRFTAAHELGHLLLHPELDSVHRDRPIDQCVARPPLERAADRFAAEFLMPPGWLASVVERMFGKVPIKLNGNLAWWLDPVDPEHLLYAGPDRDLDVALAIASCTRIGNHTSLREQFCVSATAMALRLMELGLIDRR